MKKVLKIFLSALTALCLCIGLGACSESCMQSCIGNNTFDVEMRITSSLGDEFTFYLGTDEISKTYEYTGEEIGFALTAWRMPEHPDYHDEWFTPEAYGPNVFMSSWLYTDEDGKQYTDVRVAKERGEYIITYTTSTTSDLWYFRSVLLRVIII